MALNHKIFNVLLIFLLFILNVHLVETQETQENDELTDYIKYGNRNFNRFGYFGSGVSVAIIDTGINFNHSDFKNRIINSYNVLNTSELAVDLNSHGTHIAGIIAGDGFSEKNFTGIAPKANLIVVKAIGNDGFTTSDIIIKAIEWVENTTASVINLSFSTTDIVGQGNDLLSQLINNISLTTNKVFIAATGNIGQTGDINIIGSPSGANEVISVGAVDLTGSEIVFAPFSIYGPRLDGLQKPEIVAPGVRIASTYYEGNKYGWADGTSQAAAYVSGIVVLMKEVNPNLNNREIKFILRETAQDILEPGIDNKTGWGLIDPEKAILYTIDFNSSLPYATFVQPRLIYYNWTDILNVELEFINQSNIKDVSITIKQNNNFVTSFDYLRNTKIPILTSGNYSIIANITDLQNNFFSLIKTLIISYNYINPNELILLLFTGNVITLMIIAILEQNKKRMKFYNGKQAR